MEADSWLEFESSFQLIILHRSALVIVQRLQELGIQPVDQASSHYNLDNMDKYLSRKLLVNYLCMTIVERQTVKTHALPVDALGP